MSARQPHPPEVRARATELRTRGFGPKPIADALGISIDTVRKWLYDPDGSKTAARKERYRRPCMDCGRPMTGCNGTGPNAPIRCGECGPRHQGLINGERQRAQWRWRRDRIIEMYRAGASLKEIAEACDSTVNSVGVTLHWLRREGVDLPYRRPPTRGEPAIGSTA